MRPHVVYIVDSHRRLFDVYLLDLRPGRCRISLGHKKHKGKIYINLGGLIKRFTCPITLPYYNCAFFFYCERDKNN